MSETLTRTETVTIIVDDQEVQVPAGMQLIDAISQYTDFYMPRFCYHDRLDPVGMCRMCMAEVEARGRWANVATCTLKVADGMKVRVRSEAAIKARKMTLELLLVNHPLDCPICDKGGECHLQDQTYEYGPDVARTVEPRRKYPKPLPISADVLLDRERCIQCGLCTRFVDEVAGEKTIELVYRGGATQISPALDGEYDSHFSGNTCDICPVGALTSETFRFASRPWELQRKAVVSPWDACGTNLWLDVRENVIRRVMPRENRAVNDVWCSDRDRFHATDWVLSPERLDVPLVRNAETGGLEPASFDDAIAAAVEGLAQALASGQGVLGVAGTHFGCEELHTLQTLCSELCDSPARASKPLTAVERQLGATPSFAALEQAKAILLVGNPITDLPPAWLRMYAAVRKHGAALWTLNNQDLHLGLASSFNLACEPGQEAVVLNAVLGLLYAEKKHNLTFIKGHAKGFGEVNGAWGGTTPERAAAEAGVDPARLRALADKLAGAEDLVIFGGWSVDAAARQAAWNLALLLGTPGMAAGGYLEPSWCANSRGAVEVGLASDLDAALAAAPGALLALGSDLVADAGNPWQTVRNRWHEPAAADPARRAAVERVPFKVVTELFLTETAQLADVVLPATCFAERAGTYVNFEGRAQRVVAAVKPILGVRSDLDILNALGRGLADRTGRSWASVSSDAALVALVANAVGFAGENSTTLKRGAVLPSAPRDGRWHFV